MNSPTRAAIACAAGLLALGEVALAQTPTFDLMPLGPGGAISSRMYGLSADGRTTVGNDVPTGRGFTWRRDTGRTNTGFDPELGISGALGISGDGLSITGGRNVGGFSRPYRWSGSGTLQTLGTLPFFPDSWGIGISGDGSVVVGLASALQSSATEAFRWTQQSGLQGLGRTRPFHSRSRSEAVSRDGRVVVGSSTDGPTSDAFQWTEAGGLSILTPLDNSTFSSAFGVSFDGQYIVGQSGSSTPQATLWNNGSPVALGMIPGSGASLALAVSDDAGVVAGWADLSGQMTAMVWLPDGGVLRLTDHLAANGVTLPDGYIPWTCTAVSADGYTFAGYGTFGVTGNPIGFVATIPSPPAVAALVATIPIWLRRRQRSPVS